MTNKFNKYLIKSIFSNTNYKDKLNQYGGGSYDGNNLESILDYLRDIFKNIKQQEVKEPRLFIIAYGPPGSGKSYQTQLFFNKLKNDLNLKTDISSIVKINIDDIVKDEKTYISEIEEVKKLDYSKNKEKFISIYDKNRSRVSNIFNILILLSNLINYSILVETTGGKKSFDWWIELMGKFKKSKKEYKYILVYPFSDLKKIKDRVEKRGLETLRTFTEEQVENIYNMSLNNFNNIIDNNEIKKFDYIIKYTCEDNVKEILEKDILFKYIKYIENDDTVIVMRNKKTI